MTLMRHPTLLLLACFTLAGCGRDNPLGRLPLSGKVTLNGQPLAQGAIEFHPLDGGVQSGALIKAGKYSIATADGATPGKYRIVIYDTYETPPLPPGHMPGDDIPKPPPSQVPAEWNSKSDKTVEVTKAGPNEFNFDIPGKK